METDGAFQTDRFRWLHEWQASLSNTTFGMVFNEEDVSSFENMSKEVYFADFM